MRVPQAGDPVFHLIKDGSERFLVGKSIVSRRVVETKMAPPEPGVWAGFRSYFRIELADYTEFEKVDLKDIQELHLEEIRSDNRLMVLNPDCKGFAAKALSSLRYG
ncbi:hypothetical protein ACVIWV_008332 [Bradyrhizobium diazoefficiens]|uniref:hypothetical protein n=1 Tax=Bradyrhizobium sp. YCK136 TaxID=3351346 RepID=UPI000765B189